MKVVKAEERHAEQMFEAQMRAYGRLKTNASAVVETPKDVTSRIFDPDWQVFVGVENGKIVSGISYLFNDNHAYAARWFSIDRRPPIGLNVFRESLEDARKRQRVNKLFARVDSKTKCRVYGREGFRITNYWEEMECKEMIQDKIPERKDRIYLVKTRF